MKCRMLFCAVLFGVFAFGGASPSPSQKKDEPKKKVADSDNLAKLAKRRYEAAQQAYKQTFDGVKNFVALDPPILYLLSTNLLNAHKDFKKEDSLAPFQAHFDRMLELERMVRALEAKGQGRATDVVIVESFRLEAEYWLERAKQKMKS